jgi:hypothetical protein
MQVPAAPLISPRAARRVPPLAAVALLGGCASPAPTADAGAAAAPEDGFVPIWRKDEKVWLEITPERLGRAFLLSVNVKNAVGERGL